MQQQKLPKKCFKRDAKSSPSESSSSSSLSLSSPSSLQDDPLTDDPFDDPDLDGGSFERIATGRSMDRTEQRLCSDLDWDMYDRPMAGAGIEAGIKRSIGSYFVKSQICGFQQLLNGKWIGKNDN